jgi:predicted dehydrogenase
MGRSEARLLAQIPEARLAAVCDVRAEAADAFGQEMGVPAVTDAAEVLARDDVGAVIVATPNAFHTQLVLDAAAAGKHIFCEKPLALTVEECDGMIATAQQHGVRLMVGHVLRLLPVFARIGELFDSGLLGAPVAVEITRVSGFPESAPAYRWRKASVGGLIYDVTIHEIDLLRRLCGPLRSLDAVMSYGRVAAIDYENTLQLQLRFRSGAMASLTESIAATTPLFTGVVLGERGTLSFDYRARRVSYTVAGQEPVVEENINGENGYLRELRSFTEWVLHERTPLLTWREGRAAIVAAEAAYRSAASGQAVEVEDSL